MESYSHSSAGLSAGFLGKPNGAQKAVRMSVRVRGELHSSAMYSDSCMSQCLEVTTDGRCMCFCLLRIHKGSAQQMRPLEKTPEWDKGASGRLKQHHFPAFKTLTGWVRPWVLAPSLTTKGARG